MERVEEYLETILDIQKEGKVAKTKEIADRLNIKPSSVTEMLNKLSEMGYIEYQPYKGATLTKKGYIVAARIKRNYQIFTKFFKEFLEIEDEEKVHELSCTLEHIVDNEVIEKDMHLDFRLSAMCVKVVIRSSLHSILRRTENTRLL